MNFEFIVYLCSQFGSGISYENTGVRNIPYLNFLIPVYKKMDNLIKIAEEAMWAPKEVPAFKAGDTITVSYKIIEGNKERIQSFRGVVIQIKGRCNQNVHHP